jgi:hypothetical protein
MPDKPLTHVAREDNVVWPENVPGQADASGRLLQCDDPGLRSPVAQAKRMLACRIDHDRLFANVPPHAPTFLARNAIPAPAKHQKWLSGFDSGARVVRGPHGSDRHPMDLTLQRPPRGSEHSQLDVFTPSATRDRHSTLVDSGVTDDCPDCPLASATDPRTKSATSDAMPRLILDLDWLRTQEGYGQIRMPL